MKGLVAFALALGVASAASAADFDIDSSFPANPTVGTGQFAFDLTMQVSLRATGTDGSFTVLVNSRDGSMALENPHTTLWALGMKDIPDLQVHQVIARTGELLVCGTHPETGKGCMTLGGSLASFWIPIRERMPARDSEAFFASVPLTDQSAVPCCQPGTESLTHMAGKGASGETLVFWFDPGAATVRTPRSFLGPGVGIMKDRISRTNRVARHFWVDPPEGQSPVDRCTMPRVSKSANRAGTRRFMYQMPPLFCGVTFRPLGIGAPHCYPICDPINGHISGHSIKPSDEYQ